jgi:hypothetical protein
MKIDSPLEWYQQKYCSRCKNKKCERKTASGIYTTNIDWSGKTFCALAALMLLEFDRQALREFGKQ